MGAKSVEANLVGMRYYQPGFDVHSAIDTFPVLLRREPRNEHDSNAIGVVIRDQVVGHLDKKAAAVLAPILDRGASYSIRRGELTGPRYIQLKVRVEQIVEPVNAPRVATGTTAGIYRIDVRVASKCYIGQSRDINSRIRAHWDELVHGTHSNPDLQRLWSSRGHSSFDATILERVPWGLSELQTCEWLRQREQHWINHHKCLGSAVNKTDAQLILTAEASAEARRERLRREKEAKEDRERKQERVRALNAQLAPMEPSLDRIKGEIAQLEAQIRRSSRFGGLFATAAERGNLPNWRCELSRLSKEQRTASQQMNALRAELYALSAELAPRQRTRRRYTAPWWSR